MDPHKSLFQPFGCGAVLVRDGTKLREAFNTPEIPAEETEEDFEAQSPSNYTFEMTRPFRGLGVWFCLNLMGVSNIQKALKEKLDLAKYFRAKLSRCKDIELGPHTELTYVLFRYSIYS